jgi:hypothetical protein
VKSIIVTVTDGWSYRYLFCTGVFEYLKQNYKITFFCSDYYFEKLRELEENNVNIKRIEFVKSKFIDKLISAKNYVFRIYNNFKISKFYISKLKRYQRVIVKSLNWFISLFGDYILLVFNFLLDFFINFSQAKNYVYKEYDIVLFLSPYSYEEVKLSKLIKSNVVKKIFVLPSWDNIYKYHQEDDYSKYILWGNDQKRFLEKMNIPEDKILCLGGISQYLFNKIKVNCLNPDNSNQFRILYATVTNRIFKDEFLFVKKLASYIENGFYGNNVELLIRLHPADSLDQYVSLQSAKVFISNTTTTKSLLDWNVQKDYFQKQVADILSSSLVITVASTMTLDSILLDRLTINFRPEFCKGDSDYYQFEHYASLTNSGYLPIVSSFDELNKLIIDTNIGVYQYDVKMKDAIRDATLVHKSQNFEDYFEAIFS